MISARPSRATTEGAGILSDHLFQMSGARIPVLPEDRLQDGDVRVRILVGASSLTRELGIETGALAPGEILLRTFPNALVLLGADVLTPDDPSGTRYAVTTFLEDSLGVHFLWPGEGGKVVPRRKTIDVGHVDTRFAPLLRQRKIRMGGGFGERMAVGATRLGITRDRYFRIRQAATATHSRDGGWSGWHRLGGTLRLASGHSFGDMWERHGRQHPEWFAMAPNGSRDQSASPERARLCVSNPELIDDYCRAGFGKGAEPVKRYFLRLEDLTNDIAEQGKRMTEPYTTNVVAELRAMLEEAARKTRNEPDACERVAFLRAGLEYTDAYCAIFRVNREWQASGIGRLTQEYREKFRMACDRNREVSRDVFENHHLAVNVTTVAWGSWAYFGRFGWNSPSGRASGQR